MSGSVMCKVRESKGATQQEFAVLLNERLSRRYDKSKISRWESGAEAIPGDVSGLLMLWQLAFKPTGRGAVTIVVSLPKGGVSKTLTTCALAHVLASASARVLLVDCDSQANSTALAGFGEADVDRLANEERTLYHGLIPEPPTPLSKVIQKTRIPNLDILPSSLHLALAELKLNDGKDESKCRLRDLLAGVKNDYDFIVVDTAPSLGLMTVSALAAATLILIPVQTEAFAVTGLRHLRATIAEIRQRLNPGVEILGILPTMYSSRQSQDKDSLIDIYKQAGRDKVFEPVPKSAVYGQAAAGSRIVHDVDPGAPGLSSYIEIAQALGVTYGC